MPLPAQQFGGEHTDEKLKILCLYLDYFTTVLKAKPSTENPFTLVYVDPFCGTGYSRSANDEPLREGSPLIALGIDDRPFDELYFNDLSHENVKALKRVVDSRYPCRTVRYHIDSADEFLRALCPSLQKSTRPLARGVIFLDPFATQVSWVSIEAIAATHTLDAIILFPRQALVRSTPVRHERGGKHRFERTLDRVFGDRSWTKLYDADFNDWHEATREPDSAKNLPLFGMVEIEQNPTYEFRAHASAISYLYRERLRSVFAGVSDTFAVLGSQGPPLFEVHFAVSNPSENAQTLAQRGANHILRNYRNVQIKD